MSKNWPPTLEEFIQTYPNEYKKLLDTLLDDKLISVGLLEAYAKVRGKGSWAKVWSDNDGEWIWRKRINGITTDFSLGSFNSLDDFMNSCP